MKVRSKLAGVTGLGLLLLLCVFYIGGRLVVVSTLRQTSRHLLHALPKLQGSVRGELDQLQGIAQTTALATALRGLAPGGETIPAGLVSNLWDATSLDSLAVDLLVVADAGGQLLCAFVRDAETRMPTRLQQEELRELLRPESVLVAGADGARSPVRRGLALLSGTPVLVAAAPVVPSAAAARTPVASILVGRSIGNAAVLRRITAGLPLESSVQQVAAHADGHQPGAVRSGEVVGSSILYDVPALWRTDVPIRARLPFYDIHGHQVFALAVNLGYSFKQLADLSLAWLSFLVAVIGVLFIVPLVLVQGHTVLNPLTRLADTLQAFGKGIPNGRRIGWTRRDEFGVVSSTIDQMLDAIDSEHQALVQRNEHMRALLAASPDLIIVIDREGTLTDISNHSRGSLTGLFPSLKVGDSIRQTERIPPEAIDAFLRRAAEVLDTDRIQIFESGIRQARGGLLWAELRMVRLADNRVLVMIRDVSARHRAQHERARIEEKMAQLQKTESLGVLARGMAHDFNNILTAMLGNVDVSLHEPLTPAAREAVENIRLAMIRASGLTRQMLSYAGQGTFTFEITDLNALLRDLVSLMQRSITPQAEIVLAFGDRVPLVEADATQIWQVVMNLLINASDAMASLSGTITLATAHAVPTAAEIEPYLSTAPLQPGDYAMIEVSDTGHGMDKRTIERIYDPFFTTKAMGRGLGLSACLGIVRAHNGGISVASKSGEGTRFRVLLPAARDREGRVRFPGEASGVSAPVPSPGAPSVPLPAASAARAGSRGAILVADDDAAILKLVGIILAKSGFSVIAAESGEEALRLFNKDPQRIRLALVDATLNNGLSGSEVCVALHLRNPRLPTIIMSGFREDDVGLDFTEASFTAFLPKPFMSAELLAVVDKACRIAGHNPADYGRGGDPHGALL